MKAKIAAALLLCFALTGCAKDAPEESEAASAPTASAEESAQSAETTADTSSGDASEEPAVVWATDVEDYSPYVILGAYKGVEIERDAVDDEAVETALLAILEELKEYVETDRAAATGDVVKIDYKGYMQDTGEAFEGGEDTDFSLELGSATFIPGFEDAIVGHKAGEEFDINISFPDNYGESTLAGKPVRFAIKLKAVTEPVYPPVNDETAKELGFETADKLREQAQADAEEAVYTANLQKAWEAAVSAAEIKGYPEELYSYTVNSYVDYYVGYYGYLATMYGMELSDYVGMDEEDFRAELETQGKKYAEDYLNEEMVMLAIADAEFGREIPEDEYAKTLDEYADREGVTTDALKEKYDEKSLRLNALWDKVLVFVYDNSITGSETAE